MGSKPSPAGNINMRAAIATALVAAILIASVATALLGNKQGQKEVAPESAQPNKPLAIAPAAREVCKQFISQSGYSAKDWGDSWNWTTIDNKDGTWSVGARFDGMPPVGVMRNLYVNCTAKKTGDNWALEKLTRLR